MTGKSALLLISGRTLHSTFKLTIFPTEGSYCDLSHHTNHGRVIYNSKVIIIDEATQMTKLTMEELNRTLQSLMGNQMNFGGKVVKLINNLGHFWRRLAADATSSCTWLIDRCFRLHD